MMVCPVLRLISRSRLMEESRMDRNMTAFRGIV